MCHMIKSWNETSKNNHFMSWNWPESCQKTLSHIAFGLVMSGSQQNDESCLSRGEFVHINMFKRYYWCKKNNLFYLLCQMYIIVFRTIVCLTEKVNQDYFTNTFYYQLATKTGFFSLHFISVHFRGVSMCKFYVVVRNIPKNPAK